MTDYTNLARRVMETRRAAVQALAPTKAAAKVRVNELYQAKSELKQAGTIRKQERTLLDCGIPGFFPTPPALARRMAEWLHLAPGDDVLEPSAGNGHIAEAIRDAGGHAVCVEYQQALFEVLRAKGFADSFCADFLEWNPPSAFGRIAMNPPFERGQDIAHVRRAYDICLSSCAGRLVAIMSEGVFYRQDHQAQDFRAWLVSVGGTSEQLPRDTFKQSGTMAAARIVFITKG